MIEIKDLKNSGKKFNKQNCSLLLIMLMMADWNINCIMY